MAGRNLSIQPPKVGEPFPVLVPQVDVDGNERDGVRLPEITVPSRPSWVESARCLDRSSRSACLLRSVVHFFPEDRRGEAKTGDPRKSIGERYSGREDYLARYSKAVDDSSSSAGFCPRIARFCCIEASRSGSSL